MKSKVSIYQITLGVLLSMVPIMFCMVTGFLPRLLCGGVLIFQVGIVTGLKMPEWFDIENG